MPAFVSKCAGVCQTAQIGYSITVFSIELIHYAREKTAPTTLMSTWLTSLIMIKYFWFFFLERRILQVINEIRWLIQKKYTGFNIFLLKFILQLILCHQSKRKVNRQCNIWKNTLMILYIAFFLFLLFVYMNFDYKSYIPRSREFSLEFSSMGMPT